MVKRRFEMNVAALAFILIGFYYIFKVTLASMILIGMGIFLSPDRKTIISSRINSWKKFRSWNDGKKDSLTGLFERGNLDIFEFLKYKIVSVAFLDIDNFKKINDRHSYDDGDAAIKYVASVLIDLEKQNCLVLRNHGSRGDEFIVLLLEINKEEAFKLMETCRNKINDKKINDLFNVSVSIGIATFPEDGTSKDEIIKKANKALSISKQKGKNTITKYDESIGIETKTITFRFEEISNIKKGSNIIVKSWKWHHPPNINELEAIEMEDLDDAIIYVSRNKGVLMTVKTMEKELQGIVSEVQRHPGKTVFKLRVDKNQLESLVDGLLT